MRRSRLMIVPLLLLVLAACGVPTNNTVGGSSATTQSPAASVGASAATSGAAGSAAAGADPVDRNNKYKAAPPMTIDPNKTYTATIDTTKGTMQAKLDPKDAPMAVNNFVFLARDNFYQGIKFHRIIKGFMVQTGDPTGTGTGGPGYAFEIEKPTATQKYTLGTLAMANTNRPNSNGSQFFIVNTDNAPLPPDYTIFGQVTQGQDVLQKISDTPVTNDPRSGEESLPTEDVRITKITIAEQ